MRTKIFLLTILSLLFLSCKSTQSVKSDRTEKYQDELFQCKITPNEYIYLIKAESELKIFGYE